MMSFVSLKSTPGLRSTRARSGIAARSSARTSLSDPFMARPMGVRMASMMTASGMAPPRWLTAPIGRPAGDVRPDLWMVRVPKLGAFEPRGIRTSPNPGGDFLRTPAASVAPMVDGSQYGPTNDLRRRDHGRHGNADTRGAQSHDPRG